MLLMLTCVYSLQAVQVQEWKLWTESCHVGQSSSCSYTAQDLARELPRGLLPKAEQIGEADAVGGCHVHVHGRSGSSLLQVHAHPVVRDL